MEQNTVENGEIEAAQLELDGLSVRRPTRQTAQPLNSQTVSLPDRQILHHWLQIHHREEYIKSIPSVQSPQITKVARPFSGTTSLAGLCCCSRPTHSSQYLASTPTN